MNTQLTAAWQSMYDLERTPAEAFGKIADDIREVMASEQG
jgi:hypothetical protein